MGALIPSKSISQLYTNQSVLLPKWRDAVAKVRAGTGNARLACVGDSTTAGSYSTGTHSAGQDEVTNSYPSQLARMLTASGLAANYQSFMGYTQVSYDPRISAGTAFSLDATDLTIGGQCMRAQTGASTTSPLAFTPTIQVDTFVIWYIQYVNASNPTFSYNVNGGTATNVNINSATPAMQKVVVSTTKGTNTLNINYVSGTNEFILGVEAYDSTSKSVNVIRCGWAGSKASDWNVSTSPWSPGQIATLAPDLTVLCLGINDWDNAVSVSSYTTNMQALITNAKTSGDVLLLTPVPSNPGSNSAPALSVQATYVAAMQQLAASNGIPIVDVFTRFASYAAHSTLYGDTGTHPNGAGYADVAKAVFNVIGNA